jgi:peptide/nickel transport system substrate-binding protein
MRRRFATLCLAGLLFAPALSAQPVVFRMATSTDASTLDPHASNSAVNALLLSNIYETLALNRDDLSIEPGLALSWTQVEPRRWRYVLRPGVRFHNGNAFDADDVVFSIGRALAPTSNMGIFVDTVERAERVDATTVDIVTRVPDPVLPNKMSRVMIMDREWSLEHRAERPQNFREREETHASRHTNGTGPFTLRSRVQDQRTVLARNEAWWGWGPRRGNVTEYHHVIIASDATRTAALLSGEVDMSHVVPPQDLERLRRDARLRVLEGPENRTLWLAMDQSRDELLYSNIRGRNPFRDVRVRQAIAHAIDVETIIRRTLRGQGVPTGSMWTPFVTGFDPALDRRLPLDRERARRLLAEAGYPNGFEVTLDCPVGVYDEVCLALAPMLAQVGITLRVNIQPQGPMFQKIGRLETSFFGLTWGVPTLDASYTLRAIMMMRERAGPASWNYGGYSNPRVDALIEEAEAAQDQERRIALMREAHRIHNEELGHIPLYTLATAWAVSQRVQIAHRPDNRVMVMNVTLR